MDGVKLDLLLEDFDLEVDLVEGLGHRLELADCVVDESTPLASVMQNQSGISLVIAVVGRRSESILVKIIFNILDTQYFVYSF